MAQSVSLVALRSFVEVARLGSFKGAADVLGVTPGAVSQNVKLLESRFDVVLFERSSRNVNLTERGTLLLQAVHLPFCHIDAAIESLQGSKARRNVIRVLSTASFAASWLIPKLGRFSTEHPDVEVKIDVSGSRVDLRREEFDIAIRDDHRQVDGFEATKLVTPRLIAVGSPGLLARHTPIRTPADCLSFPLLHDRDRADWATWFRIHHVETGTAVANKGASFADDSLLLTAAAASQGLALVQDVHAEDALSRRSVSVACRWSLDDAKAYYVVKRIGAPERRHAASFKTWLLDEMSSWTASSGSAPAPGRAGRAEAKRAGKPSEGRRAAPVAPRSEKGRAPPARGGPPRPM